MIHPRAEWAERTPIGPLPWTYGKRHTVAHWTANPCANDPRPTPPIMRSMEAHHMDAKGGWAIFYNFVIDPDGEIWEGRGFDMRGGAQGVGPSDELDLSIAGILCPGETPTPAMLKAFDELDQIAAGLGWDAGRRGHKDFKQKDCPGPDLYEWTKQEPNMSDPMPEWAEPIFEKAQTAGVFSQHTNPDGTVEAWELAVFLDRAGLLDPATGPHDHDSLEDDIAYTLALAVEAKGLANDNRQTLKRGQGRTVIWFDHLAVQLAAIAAALTALGIFWHKGLKPAWSGLVKLVHAVETLDSIAEYTRQLPESLPVLMDIAEEFKPDGGSTLVDRISFLEIGQANIVRQLESLQTRDPLSRTRSSDC